MNIAVFGLGYVGVVSAACLAQRGHRVVGVDISALKVDLMNDGRSPIIEEGLDELVRAGRASGRIRATADWQDAVANTDMAWVCVSTPSLPNGNIDRRFLKTVCEQIGTGLKTRDARYTVVVRSTTLPGTTREVLIPTLEAASGKRVGTNVGVCYHPEFLREGSSVHDFHSPPKIVIGASDEVSADALASLYADYDAPLVQTTMEVAEMVKYSDNTWHAVKVGFANEIGALCKELSIDGRTVMEIFCRDTKLNLSDKYLRPGFAFGGSCLPKDLRALNYEGKRRDLELPLLSSILPSNQRHIDRALTLITDEGRRRVGMLGLSFKSGTDDLRESPYVEIAERLIGKGYELRIYDPYVKPSVVTGANRVYMEAKLPHMAALMVDDPDTLVAWADTIVVGHKTPGFADMLARDRASSPDRERHAVIDLSGMSEEWRGEAGYHGVCW